MVVWLCRGIAVTADALGEYRFVLPCMFVLSGAVQRAISLEVLSVSFSCTRNLGSSPGFAVNSDRPGLSDLSGNRNNDFNDSSVEWQGLMDPELVRVMACVVPRWNGARKWQKSWTKWK
jgi:hypothetical protein